MLLAKLRRLGALDRRLPIWYDPEYRLPLTAFGRHTGLNPRRADLVAWYLLEWGWLAQSNFRAPARVRYQDIARAHTTEYLEALAHQETLARVFGVDPWDVPVDEVMHSVRLACGGTVAAALEAIARRGPAVNLAGGFHHAGPNFGAGLCPINDIAIAVAALRHRGFSGRVVVLDLDAHAPDGTMACLAGDPMAWVGALSGNASGPMANADLRLLPPDADDATYLAALRSLLAAMPRPDLAFVIAGGDVLAGDHLGGFALTLDGARRRDLAVVKALSRVPSVWLPGGGYHDDAWRVLAGTVLALLWRTRRPIEAGDDPMAVRYIRLARRLRRQQPFSRRDDTDFDDVAADLGLAPARGRLFLGVYSREALEYAFHRYGVLAFLERRGYGYFRVAIDRATSGGERVRLLGQSEGTEHTLIEVVLERLVVGGREVLYVHWLSLRDPRARFSDRRPQLPGQEVPGLGLAREVTGMMRLVADRLKVAGLAFRPAHYHTAYVSRAQFRFLDPARQGRFEALLRDLGSRSVVELSHRLAGGEVFMNGVRYEWEPSEMVYFTDPLGKEYELAVEAERQRVRFTIAGEMEAAAASPAAAQGEGRPSA